MWSLSCLGPLHVLSSFRSCCRETGKAPPPQRLHAKPHSHGLGFHPPGVWNYLIGHNWEFECTFNFINALSSTGRPLFMTCMCLDCFQAVVHPITYHLRKGLTYRVLMSVGVWAITVANGTALLLDPSLFSSPVIIVPYIISILTHRGLWRPHPQGSEEIWSWMGRPQSPEGGFPDHC